MWKNVKFKKGALSILLILGLVLTNLSPLGAWAEDAAEAVVEALDGSEQSEGVVESLDGLGEAEGVSVNKALEDKKEALRKEFNDREALEDVKLRLQDFKVTVIQNGEEVKPGSNIVTGKDLRIALDFKVPVKGDLEQALAVAKTLEDLEKIDINKYIKSGDKAKITLSKGIKLKDGLTYTDILKDKDGNKIGEGAFKKEGNDDVVFTVNFVGDDKNQIYDGSRYNVGVQAGADFSLDTTNNPSNPGTNSVIEIYGKTYNIENTYDKVQVEKSGEVNYTDNGKSSYPTTHKLSWQDLIGEDKTGSGSISITWTVKVSREDINGKPVDLDGYKFTDDLTNVGGYIPETFYVGKDENSTVQVKDSSLQDTDKKLTYVFPAGSGTKAVIKFNTSLKNSEFRSGVTKKNTAKVLNPKDVEVGAADGKVDWKVSWGKKSAQEKGKDASGREERFYKEKVNGVDHYFIDWIIEFNHKKWKLDNVRLVDDLQRTINNKYGLEFVSGKWEPLSGEGIPTEFTSDKIGKEKFGPKDERRVYKIGNIDKPIKVTIKSEVKKVENDKLVSLKAEDLKERIRFSNWAVMLWGTDYNTTFWTEAYIGPGSLITKKTIDNPKGEGWSGATNEWQVTVPSSSVQDKTFVYDTFIFDFYKAPNFGYLKRRPLTDFKLIDKDGNTKLQSGVDFRDIIPTHVRYNKYIDDSFKSISPANLQRRVYKIIYQDKHIGDIVEVWGLSKSQENKFNLKSTMTGPQFIITKFPYISNYNIAHIVNDGLIQDNAEAWSRYKTRMLQKQALTAASTGKIVDGETSVKLVNADVYKVTDGDYVPVNNTAKRAINNKTVAYNKEKNSIIYRISVNAAGISGVTDYTGKFLLTDVLADDRWKFVPIKEGGPDYLIYEGSSYSEAYSDDAVVKAENGPLNDLSFLDLNETKIEGKTANFLFNKLDKPYVILLRATTVSNDALANKSGTLNNKATLKFNSYGDNAVTSTQDVDYNRGVLSKTYNDDNISKRYITWTIGYEPYKFKTQDKAVYLEDKLGDGLDIRRNKDKTLAFDGENYKMFEGRLENGQFIQEHEITTDKLKTLLSYDGNNRILKINIPERTKAYRFIYITDIVNKTAGQKVTNTVKLIEGGNSTHIEDPKEYYIADAYMSGSSDKFPVFTIYKTDETGTTGLEKAEFTILEKKTKLTTDAGGKVTTQNLPYGEYTVKETVPPKGYNIKTNEVEFKVKINQLLGGGVQVSLVDNYNPLVTIKDGIITVKNTKNTVGFKIVKASSDEKTKANLQDIKRLKKAKFTLTRLGSTTPENVIENNNGEFEFKNLIAGVYDLEETVVPANHKGLEKKTYRILVDPTQSGEAQISVLKRNGSQYMPLTTNDTEIKKFGDTFVVFNDRTKPDTAEFTLVKADIVDKKASKLDDIKNKLEGATFKLTKRDDETKTQIATTSALGTLTFKGLVAGDYILKELKAPNDYLKLMEDYVVTFDPSKEAGKRVVVKNPKSGQIKQFDDTIVVFNEKLSELVLKKADLVDKDVDKLSDLKNLLDGAEFTLVANFENGLIYANPKVTGKEDEKGTIVFKNLKAGTYTLIEKKAPTDYAILAKEYKITVTPGAIKTKPEIAIEEGYNNDYIKVIDNTIVVFNEKVADLTLVKTSLAYKNAASIGEINTKLQAKFTLTKSDNTVSYAAVTKGGSATIKGLKAGKYILKETEAPDGYNKLIDTYEIVVAPGENPEITINKAKPDEIKLLDGNVVVYNEQMINKFDLNLVKADFADRKATTTASITTKLDGAEFILTYPDSSTKSAVTKDGRLTFSGLDAGVYRLKETVAPAGYGLLPNEYEITVTPGAVSGKRIAIKNANENEVKLLEDNATVVVFNEKLYDLNILKADFDANKAVFEKFKEEEVSGLKEITKFLSGVRFGLTPSGSSVTAYKEDITAVTAGSLTFSGLSTGTYKLEEKATIAGYDRLTTVYGITVTTAAVNAKLGKEEKDEFAITANDDDYIAKFDNTIVVLNKKTPDNPGGGGDKPVPDPDPNPGPNPDPNPGPNPGPNPNPPTPTTDLPRYPENDFPNPNDPGSPDEFVAVDDEGTPQGKYVKSKKPDGTNEYIPVDEDGTPLGVNKAKKKLPKTGGSDTTVYYAGGAILLMLAAGVVVFRRKKYNE